MPTTKRLICCWVALAALLLAAMALTSRGDDSDTPIDWARARLLMQKKGHGQPLSDDEQAFMVKAQAEHDRLVQEGKWPPPGFNPDGGAGRPGPAAGGVATDGHESVGYVPLNQMKADEKYKGEEGGLYGGGKNTPPEAQQKLADTAATRIVPLDAQGKPAPDGKVVLMSIGMSNTTQEYSRFKEIADADTDKNAHLVIVDGAQGGMAGAQWIGAQSQHVWDNVHQRLAAAGVTPQQVQVIWIKQAMIRPGAIGEFPKHTQALTDDVITCLNLAMSHFPNLRVAYLSSRIYGGYAVGDLNPEPYAYEGAFAMRDVILDQIKGDPRLNADASKGEVKSPVVLWGPYLWADGVKGRESDDLVWKHEDLGPDGTHPSTNGRQKVALLLLHFFKSDSTARPWFVRPGAPEPGPLKTTVQPAPATKPQ